MQLLADVNNDNNSNKKKKTIANQETIMLADNDYCQRGNNDAR